MRVRSVVSTRVSRPDGSVDAQALQRQLDAMTSLLESLASGPVGALSTLPIDILVSDVDPRTDGIDARIGSLCFRFDRTSASPTTQLYFKRYASSTGWQLVTMTS